MYSQLYLLDVVNTPWLEQHKTGIWFFSIFALLAIGTLVGIFIYRRKHKKST